jgi:diguanylate cyclase (GGDEF)-like protein/PAS domain S-box-containing protein
VKTAAEVLPVVDSDERVIGFAARVHRTVDRRRQPRKQRTPIDAAKWFDIVQRFAGPVGMGILSFDPTSDSEFFVGPRTREPFGLDPEAPILPGMLRERMHPDDRALAFEAVQRAFVTGDTLDIKFRVLHPDGLRWLRAFGRCVTDDTEDTTRFVGVVEDATQAQQQLDELDRMRTFAELLFEKSPIGASSAGADRRIAAVNDAMLNLLGFERSDYVGRLVDELAHPDDADREHELFDELRAGVRDSFGVPRRLLKADGSYVSGRLFVSAIRDENGEIIQTVAQFLDQTEIHQAQEQLRFMSLYDPLTSLPRWALFLDRVGYEIEWSQQSKHRVGVVLLDIDRFVEVNDQFGNEGGNMVLVELSLRLADGIKVTDSLGRFEGDEFAALRSEFDDPLAIDELAEDLMALFEIPFTVNGVQVHLTPSIGTALAQPGDGAERLLRNAQFALAEAKGRGGDRIVKYDDSLRTTSKVRAAAESRLREALEREEFVLHYQPIADLQTGEFVGVEALIRWDAELGLLYPVDFIGVAEESGLIVPIGTWVLEHACAEVAKWRVAGDQLARLSVNVSPIQLRNRNLVEVIGRALEESGMSADRLTIELTETTFVEDLDSGSRALAAIQELGVRLSVDDFGTGYSGLSRIKRYSVDELKIDGSFTSTLETDESARGIIPAIVEMGRALGTKVIAEGVEDLFQMQWLRENGCRFAQGYYFAKPMPAAECELLLRRGWRAERAARERR